MKGLNGKICVIAGGATGIGRGTAIRLAEEGAKVVVGDINNAAAREAAALAGAAGKSCGGKAIAVAFDMADDASVAALIKTAEDQFGGLDAIHVNAHDMATIPQDLDAVEIALPVFDRTLQVGLRGHLLCTRHALPPMLKRGGGSIAYTSSGAAFMGEPTRVAYAICKAGMLALMRHVARRWGKEGIRANAVAPGLVVTEQLQNQATFPAMEKMVLAGMPSARLGKPSDIAAMIAFLFSEEGAWVTGQSIAVDGGSTMR